MAPDLMNIPPEVQNLIGGHLHISDLSSLSRTCKTLNNAFLAKLYSHVVIRVPIRWSRLVSLENLVSSTGSGLKFITSIRVIAQQQPLNNETQESEDGRTAQEIAEERDLFFCLPSSSASKALNGIIRLLLMRIPDNRLKGFSWRHSCAVETSTLALLVRHQGATLRGLSVTRYPEPQNSSSLLVQGLQYVVITDLNIGQRCEWPSKLIVQNRNTVRHLHLGVMSTVAQDYATHNRPGQRELPASFREMAREELTAFERDMMLMFSLETLGLYGLNFVNVVEGALGLQIAFDNMTSLRLESCSGLNEAFTILMGHDASQNTTLSAFQLRSFFVRHEGVNQTFTQQLTAFLTSFMGLKHLVLLLEGHIQAMSKAPILKKHGKTLRTLVWDERRRPRKDTIEDTAVFTRGNNNLNLIAYECPNLKALGLSVRWGMRRSTRVLPRFDALSWNMPKLRTLHLRNLPRTDLTASFLATDYMVKGLASSVLDLYAGGKPSKGQKSVTTIALGAPIYRDTHIGSNYFPSDPVRDYLQLRVYHVDYKYQSAIGPSPTITQVAKGTAYDATTCQDKDILHEYWLA